MPLSYPRKIVVLFLLGFASGLPLVLTSSALTAWFTQSKIDLSTIGLITLIGQPYVYKFIWAPTLDVIKPPILSLRRGWLLLTQIPLLLSIVAMGFFNPVANTSLLLSIGLLTAFLSATQDIPSSAYLADTLNETPTIRGLGSACYTLGYRVAILVGSGGAILIAQALSWQQTYWLMGALMLVGIVATLLAPETPREALNVVPKEGSKRERCMNWFRETFRPPLQNFFHRFGGRGVLLILAMMLLYKFGDALTLSLNTPFLYQSLGFSMQDIGLISKGVGLWANILGGLLGGLILTRTTLYRALIYFGVLQAVSNLGYYWLALAGHHYALMVSVVVVEFFTGGMATTAFVALTVALCDKRYSAAQYAVLSALSAAGRVYIGPIAAAMVKSYGWSTFYLFCFFLSIPAVALVVMMRKILCRVDTLTA